MTRLCPVPLLLAAGALAPVAQTQVYDIAMFSPLPGWRAKRLRASTTFTHTDQAARAYCIMGVYASTPASSSPDADFGREWEALVRNGFSALAAPLATIDDGSRLRRHEMGRFSIEDAFPALRPDEPGQRQGRYRVTGADRSAEGCGSFLLPGVTRDDFPFLSAGSRRPRAGGLYVGGR